MHEQQWTHVNKYTQTYPTALSLLLLWKLFGNFLYFHFVNPMVCFYTSLWFFGKYAYMSCNDTFNTCFLPCLSHGCLLLCFILFPTTLRLIIELEQGSFTTWEILTITHAPGLLEEDTNKNLLWIGSMGRQPATWRTPLSSKTSWAWPCLGVILYTISGSLGVPGGVLLFFLNNFMLFQCVRSKKRKKKKKKNKCSNCKEKGAFYSFF